MITVENLVREEKPSSEVVDYKAIIHAALEPRKRLDTTLGTGSALPGFTRAEAYAVLGNKLRIAKYAGEAADIKYDLPFDFDSILSETAPEVSRKFSWDSGSTESKPFPSRRIFDERLVPKGEFWEIDVLNDGGFEEQREAFLAEYVRIIQVFVKESLKKRIQADLEKTHSKFDEVAFDEACEEFLEPTKIMSRGIEISHILRSFGLTSSRIGNGDVDSGFADIQKAFFESMRLMRQEHESNPGSVDILRNIAGTPQEREQILGKIALDLAPYGAEKTVDSAVLKGFVAEVWLAILQDAVAVAHFDKNASISNESIRFLAAKYFIEQIKTDPKQFFEKHRAKLEPFFTNPDALSAAQSRAKSKNPIHQLANFLAPNPILSQVNIEQYMENDAQAVVSAILRETNIVWKILQGQIDISVQISLTGKAELEKVALTQDDLVKIIQDTFVRYLRANLSFEQKIVFDNSALLGDVNFQDQMKIVGRFVKIVPAWHSFSSLLEANDYAAVKKALAEALSQKVQIAKRNSKP